MITIGTQITTSSEETFELGKSLAGLLGGGEVIALHGELGSGKTVFAQGIAYGLGLRTRITSPTFLIIKHYSVTKGKITDFYHADLYRISGVKDAQEIGLNNMALNPHAITVIEWPEKMASLLSKKTIHITFLLQENDKRLVIDGDIEAYSQKAIQVLRSGGIVIFPTDTAFGIGCRIDDEEAVKKLFTLRQRPLSKATPVLFESIDQVDNFVKEVPQSVRSDLMMKYWPGPLTIVLNAQVDKVTSLVRGGGVTLGVRIPDNEFVKRIIRGVGVPIIGTSANFHGRPTPYQFSDLDPELCALVDFVAPGICSVKRESTVVDCSVMPWKILREGVVKITNNS